MKKLTLSAEEDVIATAHRIAEEQGTSISSLFSRFIRSLARERTREKVGRLTHKATGIVEMPTDESESDLLGDALLEKHGLDS